MSKTASQLTPDPSLRRAVELRDKGNLTAAKALLDDLLVQQPGNYEALFELGQTLYQQGKKPMAIEAMTRALESNPTHIDALLGIGICYNDLRKYKAAKEYCQKVIELDPGNHTALGHLGKACVENDEFEQGIYYFQRAFKLAKRTSYARGLAKGYRKSGRHGYAVNILKQILSEHPEDHEARFSLGLSLMHLERFPEALKCLESRHQLAETEGFRQRLARIFSLPAYGGEDLSDKSLLLFTEQGYGDILQFARYITLLRPKAGRLYLWCRDGLAELFEHNFDLDLVTEDLTAIPDADFRLALMSIPRFFDDNLDYLGDTTPYLSDPPGQKPLSVDPARLNIGLVWGAEPQGFDYTLKRVPLNALSSLFEIPGIQWYSLQVGHDRKDLAGFKHRDRIVDLADAIHSFADTARAIAELDLVISCDTSVAHLAGAMGKPLWMMLKMDPDWRWQADGTTSRWYGTSRLYRQYARGEWSNVIKRIHDDLAVLANSKTSQAGAALSREPARTTGQKAIEKAIRAARSGNTEEALRLLDEAIQNDTGNASAHNEQGVIYYRQGNLEDACLAFRRAIEENPDFARAHTNLGACYNELGDNPNAIDCYEKALAIAPEMPDSWGNMAKAYADSEEFEMAVYCYRKALNLESRADFQRGLAKVYRKSGRYDRAEEQLRQVIRNNPADPDAHFALALTLFHRDRYPEAIREFEWRRQVKDMLQHARDLYPIFNAREYAGEDLSNSTLLLHTEQGYGDNIQFARFIRLLKPRVNRLVMWTRPGLGRLFQECFQLDEVSEDVFQLPDFEYHLPLLSLPFYFDPHLQTLTTFTPYIQPDNPLSPQRAGEKLRVGLVWGASDSGHDHRGKRVPLAELKPLLAMGGVEWHALQLGSDRDDIDRERLGHCLIDRSPEIRDFADTASIIAQLDMVVSCDTAVAHLAGAMGKPVWVMLKKHADWRWQGQGDRCAWYPTAKPYRQNCPGDWSSVIESISGDLVKLLSKHSPLQ